MQRALQLGGQRFKIRWVQWPCPVHQREFPGAIILWQFRQRAVAQIPRQVTVTRLKHERGSASVSHLRHRPFRNEPVVVGFRVRGAEDRAGDFEGHRCDDGAVTSGNIRIAMDRCTVYYFVRI